MNRALVGAAAVALLAGAASADVIRISGSITPGTIGSHPFGVNSDDRITAGVFGTETDTVMRLLDPSMKVVATDDDGGPGFLSAIRYNAVTSGSYTLQVSDFPDLAFAGASTSFNYHLVYSTGNTGTETEGNNTIATANNMVYGTDGSAIGGELLAGDVDFFAFNATAGEYLTAQLDDLGNGGVDTIVGLFDPAGNLIASNDDSFAANSSLEFTVGSAGTYYWAVTGFSDFDFNGSHEQAGRYRLVTSGGSAVPAPGTLAALGLASLLGLRRRR